MIKRSIISQVYLFDFITIIYMPEIALLMIIYLQ